MAIPGSNPLDELLPPLTEHEASVEANRCLYCYDAPCIQACPTGIDVPKFIRQIATGNTAGAATTIFDENLLGATCARVCPVRELCEKACVLGADHKPIAIGRLQRYATDRANALDQLPSVNPVRSELRVAVVGSGPAGLSCAGELARRGHRVTIFERKQKPGGLSTHGIIGLREPLEVALNEVRMIERLGVEIVTNQAINDLGALRANFDAVFLAVGLGGTPPIRIENEAKVLDGLDYIQVVKFKAASLKNAARVVVIGGGNTALDCATVARRLGAKVTIVYRRAEAQMPVYAQEMAFARTEGIEFRFETVPNRVALDARGDVSALECLDLSEPNGQRISFPADVIVRATGQSAAHGLSAFGLETHDRFLVVDKDLMTSLDGVYAGGDCIRAHGAASTVSAVQDGKLAARAIHSRWLSVASNHEEPCPN